MTTLPVPLPDTKTAQLPASYEQAKQALAECERLDECKTWADKMAALASYGRQAHDDSLVKHAMRIQVRAIQRAGELLREFDARQGQNLPVPKSGGDPTFSPAPISRREAAEAAGMSKDQQVQAVRVANIPKPDFERLIEGDNPPTVTALAEMGKKPRPQEPAAPEPRQLDIEKAIEAAGNEEPWWKDAYVTETPEDRRRKKYWDHLICSLPDGRYRDNRSVTDDLRVVKKVGVAEMERLVSSIAYLSEVLEHCMSLPIVMYEPTEGDEIIETHFQTRTRLIIAIDDARSRLAAAKRKLDALNKPAAQNDAVPT
jgi:hypothetical protein